MAQRLPRGREPLLRDPSRLAVCVDQARKSVSFGHSAAVHGFDVSAEINRKRESSGAVERERLRLIESSDDVYLNDGVRRNHYSFEYFVPFQAGAVQFNDRLPVCFRIAEEPNCRPSAGDH